MNEMRRFFRERWIELLIAGIWLQSVISAAFSGSWALLATTTLGGLVLLLAVFWIVGRLARRRRPSYGEGEAFATPRQAMVFTVGRQFQTILFVLENQQPRPDWLGIVCSRETIAVADEIKTRLGMSDDQVQPEIVDPWSVVEVRTKTASILDWLASKGIAPTEVAVDITGGTAIMSAGAFSMAAERHIDCQYVRSDYDENNKPIPNTQRAVFVARYPI
ncbi:MAG: hypothetical protein JW900_03450 [Anaerolineae bacterium]|nr:hypothetical protein [Anaerolineae bacterium]